MHSNIQPINQLISMHFHNQMYIILFLAHFKTQVLVSNIVQTALVKVSNVNSDQGDCSAWMLLDMSAAFDLMTILCSEITQPGLVNYNCACVNACVFLSASC